MKKIIQTLQQKIDFVDSNDRKKLQKIVRELKTIRFTSKKTSKIGRAHV